MVKINMISMVDLEYLSCERCGVPVSVGVWYHPNGKRAWTCMACVGHMSLIETRRFYLGIFLTILCLIVCPVDMYLIIVVVGMFLTFVMHDYGFPYPDIGAENKVH